MNGCFVYNKIARNVRTCYRSYGENEFNIELKRQFSLSARFEAPHRKTFSLKSVFECDSRKELWDKFKSHCNDKLAVLGEILTKQCNFVASHRLRRMNQIWNLYTHLYTESTIRQIVSQLAKSLRSQNRPFSMLFGIALFSWEREKITDEEIEKYVMPTGFYIYTCSRFIFQWVFFIYLYLSCYPYTHAY